MYYFDIDYFDIESAEPQVNGHVASRVGELHYDLPQFLEHGAVFSLGGTRFKTLCDIHVLLAAILAGMTRSSQAVTKNICAVQLGCLKANDPPLLHLVLHLLQEIPII